jgi:uncharacterized protein (DUF305 family)
MNRKIILAAVAGFVISAMAFSLVAQLSNDNDQDLMEHIEHSSGMGDGVSAAGLSRSDSMFLQMMIPHHQQAIVISDYALSNSDDSRILSLAKQIKFAQQPEIDQMKQWLKSAGLGTDPGHSMSGMGGMLSDSQLQILATSKGSEFNKLFLRGMIDHHIGAVNMVTMIEDSKNPKVKELGSNIKISQTKEIEQMRDLLSQIK